MTIFVVEAVVAIIELEIARKGATSFLLPLLEFLHFLGIVFRQSLPCPLGFPVLIVFPTAVAQYGNEGHDEHRLDAAAFLLVASLLHFGRLCRRLELDLVVRLRLVRLPRLGL